jgi:hypothetical protein
VERHPEDWPTQRQTDHAEASAYPASDESYFRISPSPSSEGRPSTGLVAALVVAALLAVAGWTTAAVALVGGDDPVPAASVTVEPSGTPAPAQLAPSLPEAPCDPASATAEAAGLTNPRTTAASAALDGTGTAARLTVRCGLSADEVTLTVDLLRSRDTAELTESFEFHRREAADGGEGVADALRGVGKRAVLTTGRPGVTGRTTVAIEVLGTDREVSIMGTTFGGHPVTDTRDLLVAMARAYLAAR